MKDGKIKQSIVQIKNYFIAWPKAKRIRAGVIAGLIVLAAIALTVWLNHGRSGYRVLYQDLSAEEAGEVYRTLQELGGKPQLNAQGEVMVPSAEYDVWLLQLAAKGYPQTALPYDVFASHAGMTATEAESEQWLLYQLQDRIQATLQHMEGVSGADVTINMPESSDYIWEQAEGGKKASAGILLNLKRNVELTPLQVTAIKNLVASSVPQMEPADVTVVDAATSLELSGTADGGTGPMASGQNLLLEQQGQQQIEDNIVRVLTPRYGHNGVVAAAKVTLDYDAMMTEKMELIERPENGGGYVTQFQEGYGINGSVAAGGLVGEEDNTDIPNYAYRAPNTANGMTDYSRKVDYDYGYIKTQVEKGNAILSRATVSVMVDEETMSEARRAELVSLISNSADIDPLFITVSSFHAAAAAPEDEAPQGEDTAPTVPLWVLIAAGAALLLVVLAVIVALLVRRRKRRLAALALADEAAADQSLASRIESYQEQLEAPSDEEEAVLQEVRDFAKTNPEITANLLRSWLKEEDN